MRKGYTSREWVQALFGIFAAQQNAEVNVYCFFMPPAQVEMGSRRRRRNGEVDFFFRFWTARVEEIVDFLRPLLRKVRLLGVGRPLLDGRPHLLDHRLRIAHGDRRQFRLLCDMAPDRLRAFFSGMPMPQALAMSE
jgi:hypothetical protein